MKKNYFVNKILPITYNFKQTLLGELIRPTRLLFDLDGGL